MNNISNGINDYNEKYSVERITQIIMYNYFIFISIIEMKLDKNQFVFILMIIY